MIAKLLFFIFAFIAVGSAFGVVTRRNPVHSGVALLFTFISFAAIYVLLNAQFIAAIQISVYAGAILVLVLFVIMLLNLREPSPKFSSLVFKTRQGVASLVFVGFFAMQLAVLIFLRHSKLADVSGGYDSEKIATTGAIQSLSEVLFSKYLLPFEVASVLLLVAIVGAVVLTRRRRDMELEDEKGGQE